TVIALAVIARRAQPTLILVHTKELLHQWVERIATFLGIDAGRIGDGSCEIRPVTVAIVNSARNRLSELPAHFGQICVDECHRVPASLYTDVVTAFDCQYSLGLSATAFRRDGLTCLIHLFLGDTVWKIDPKELQTTGAVLQPQFIQRPTEFKYVYRGDYQALMKALTKNDTRNRLIATDILEEAHRGEGTVLVVSDRVAHCEQLAELLEEAADQVRVAVLTGKTPAEERESLVSAIRENRIDVLIATLQLIGEGFDCPNLRSLFLTTPIKFSGRVHQVVGRILRPEEGKIPRVIDYVDQCSLLQKTARARQRLFSDNDPYLLP
ncbi:DEAD/DEAH box helicase, partial [Thermodesulfobacteriota bacterium]